MKRQQRKHEPGQTFRCITCGKEFYRQAWRIRRGETQYCSNLCVGKGQTGKGNPFWGRTHNEEARAKISASRKGKNTGNQTAKGYRHTEEAKKRISAASKKLWEEHRDKMIASLPRGVNHAFRKPPEKRRYRKKFTPRQRREWISSKCAFCGTTENLELDHIIPIFDGGVNHESNCQTLCRGCNLWKTKYVDLPRRHAFLALQGGQI